MNERKPTMNPKLELEREILKMLPKKRKYNKENMGWQPYITARNSALSASLTALEKRVATREEIIKILTYTFVNNYKVTFKLYAQALQKEFVVLRKGE